jgi:hypothetical protein
VDKKTKEMRETTVEMGEVIEAMNEKFHGRNREKKNQMNRY